MSVKVIAELEIKNNPGNAVADAHRVRGLYGPCATHIERNAIPDDVRRRDMRVITSNDGKQWQLFTGGPWAHDNTDWFEVTGSGGGGGGTGGDTGSALRAMGAARPLVVSSEAFVLFNKEIYSMAYRRGSDPGGFIWNDLLIVASDGVSDHVLYSYIPNTASPPSYASDPVLAYTIPEPGELYVVTPPTALAGMYRPRTLLYIVGPTSVYEAVQGSTYTSPTGFVGGFMAQVTDTTVSPPLSILLVTCPSTDRVLSLSLDPQETPGGLPVSLVATPGSTPTGICATDTGTFWISFPGTGSVEEFVFENLPGHLLQATGLSAAVTIVSNLAFDGKYAWGVGLGSPLPLFRIRVSDGQVTTVDLTDVDRTTGGTARSRVAFDGCSIFVTSQGGLLFQIHPETLEVLHSSRQNNFTLGPMAAGGYGLPAQIEFAYAPGSGVDPAALLRVDRGQDLSAAFLIDRGTSGSNMTARINWPAYTIDVPVFGNNLTGSVCLTLGSKIFSNYASSLAGFGHTITGDQGAALSGQNCIISGFEAAAGGEGATASGRASLAFGTGTINSSGDSSQCFGIDCETRSDAIGGMARGYRALSRLPGEMASSSFAFGGSGTGTAQRSTWGAAAQLTGSAFLVDFMGGNFVTQSGYIYGIDATVIVTSTDGTERARFDRKLFVSTVAGFVVIDSELDVFTFRIGMATTDVVFSVSGNDIRIQVTNVADGRAFADLVIQALSIP